MSSCFHNEHPWRYFGETIIILKWWISEISLNKHMTTVCLILVLVLNNVLFRNVCSRISGLQFKHWKVWTWAHTLHKQGQFAKMKMWGFLYMYYRYLSKFSFGKLFSHFQSDHSLILSIGYCLSSLGIQRKNRAVWLSQKSNRWYRWCESDSTSHKSCISRVWKAD